MCLLLNLYTDIYKNMNRWSGPGTTETVTLVQFHFRRKSQNRNLVFRSIQVILMETLDFQIVYGFIAIVRQRKVYNIRIKLPWHLNFPAHWAFFPQIIYTAAQFECRNSNTRFFRRIFRFNAQKNSSENLTNFNSFLW